MRIKQLIGWAFLVAAAFVFIMGLIAGFRALSNQPLSTPLLLNQSLFNPSNPAMPFQTAQLPSVLSGLAGGATALCCLPASIIMAIFGYWCLTSDKRDELLDLQLKKLKKELGE